MKEKIQQAFTKKVEGLESLDYHQKLKECNLYSMEIREKLMIYAWQMFQGSHKSGKPRKVREKKSLEFYEKSDVMEKLEFYGI